MLNREQLAINLIKQCEGCKLKAYPDSGMVSTIGYGTTIYPNGQKVKIGDICTQKDAESYLEYFLKKNIFPVVDKICKNKPIPDKVYAALSSLGYNCGSALSGTSIINAINHQNWNELALGFRKYVEIDGKFSTGLKNRREIEIKFFLL